MTVPGQVVDSGAAEGTTPRLLVFSSLYPSSVQPNAGLFIRERMSKVAQRLPLVVVSPVPWFPLQGLVRLFRPHYRPTPPAFEDQGGIHVHYPRFLSVPGLFRHLDGWFMALGSWRTVRRLQWSFGANIIDSHFAYPDGYAANLLSTWLKMPMTVTLRGTEHRMARQPKFRKRILRTLNGAACVIAVANSLKQVVAETGATPAKVVRVANGVDGNKFYPLPRDTMREQLQLAPEDPVLISVGGLVPRKGFHRVIEILPRLRETWPTLRFLVVGGSSAEGDFSRDLERMVSERGLGDCVRFLGAQPPDELKSLLSAADVFVLATQNEGWANVFLEAMACGLPVVTTRVGGNAEVVTSDDLGELVEFGNSDELARALDRSLAKAWDRNIIRQYALDNSWDSRVDQLCQIFAGVLAAANPDVREPRSGEMI